MVLSVEASSGELLHQNLPEFLDWLIEFARFDAAETRDNKKGTLQNLLVFIWPFLLLQNKKRVLVSTFSFKMCDLVKMRSFEEEQN